ncbi:hypothetical protein B0H15DRAFT_840637 [Mycena belliarum]|uniref:DUF6533 domain-containing protein n=1 Tax=Mycena belliarum TaxID=1033014 RepID=A0AAD6U6D7_9AGAR|nr:hypothetical protein B0H15DRAFT_840637 [Mycena belliae]
MLLHLAVHSHILSSLTAAMWTYPTTMAGTHPDDLRNILELVQDSRLTSYVAVASLCLLIYDHIDCFIQEVELMWSCRFGLAKLIYLWNRYFSLIALRVWILYGRPRLLIWIFASIGLGTLGVGFVAYPEMTSRVGCYASRADASHLLALAAVAPLIVTFLMFALTVYKCWTTLRHNTREGMPLWRLFLRDGVVWFLAVFAATGAQLLLWGIRREGLKQLFVVVYSVVASRTLLNIKKIMVRPDPQMEVSEYTAITIRRTSDGRAGV